MRITYAASPPIENKEGEKLGNETSTIVALDVKAQLQKRSKRISEVIQA